MNLASSPSPWFEHGTKSKLPKCQNRETARILNSFVHTSSENHTVLNDMGNGMLFAPLGFRFTPVWALDPFPEFCISRLSPGWTTSKSSIGRWNDRMDSRLSTSGFPTGHGPARKLELHCISRVTKVTAGSRSGKARRTDRRDCRHFDFHWVFTGFYTVLSVCHREADDPKGMH